ncbi:hypothetical protein ACVWXU_000407 [Streptomyces sp. TE33382]
MRVRHALAAAGLGATLAIGVTATPVSAVSVAEPSAAAAMTCDAWSNATQTIAYGGCTGTIPAGVKWRLGVICDGGYYWWSTWHDFSYTKSYDCPGVPGKVTSTWVDVQ